MYIIENMKDQQFKENIAFGNIYEKKAVDYFQYDDFKIEEGKVSTHDIVFTKDNKEIKVEVKSDRMAYKTGNICIEVESNGVLSGISVTEAHYWLYFVINPNGENTIYKFSIDKLWELTNRFINNYRFGGYKKLSKMVLVPTTLLHEYIV